AWMLWSHKLLRWLTPVAVALLAIAWLLPASGNEWTRAVTLLGLGAAAVGWWWPGEASPGLVRFPAYGVGAVVAALHAWGRALTGGGQAVWEPTRRRVTTRPDGPA
ncbi:MAG: hypothetical protein M3N43_10000, partial [Actinomycetota bacterium]|nr:hypothetical protein [Actinomycetota bacterium]